MVARFCFINSLSEQGLGGACELAVAKARPCEARRPSIRTLTTLVGYFLCESF